MHLLQLGLVLCWSIGVYIGITKFASQTSEENTSWKHYCPFIFMAVALTLAGVFLASTVGAKVIGPILGPFNSPDADAAWRGISFVILSALVSGGLGGVAGYVLTFFVSIFWGGGPVTQEDRQELRAKQALD